MEFRQKHKRRFCQVEEYVAQYPELAAGGIPCDLVYEEYYIRRRAGEAIEPTTYFERFPALAAELRRMLTSRHATRSTSLVPPKLLDEVHTGERLDDFDLLTMIGRGAFACVYLARQRSMQRLVALKVAATAADEPQTLARLDHPNIVRVYDQRELPDLGLHLLYMQYVAGGNLQQVLQFLSTTPPDQRNGRTYLQSIDKALADRGESAPHGSALREQLARMSWPEVACWLGARVAAALGYAHKLGVLHRDIKPANILISSEGSPLLADFNISFCSKVDGASPAAFFGGSLAYMSPEQLEAFHPSHPRDPGDLDGRSDLYSLGIVLTELLTGRRPFQPEALQGDWLKTVQTVIDARRLGDRTAAELTGFTLPGLDRVLKTCLAEDRDRRYATGEELSRELNLCLHPAAEKLLHPPNTGWQAAVRRYPVLAVLVAGLFPNLLAAGYNLAYNYKEIVTHLEGAQLAFWTIQTIVNSISFPLAVLIFWVLLRPIARALRIHHPPASGGGPQTSDPPPASGSSPPTSGPPPEAGGGPQTSDPPPASGGGQGGGSAGAELLKVSRRCLALGHYAAAISIGGWVAAGIAYPLALKLAIGDVPAAVLIHFFVSLLLCGLIAAAYPFFTVSALVTHVLFPALRPHDDADTRAALTRLGRQSSLYLLVAASVPMLAMTLLVFAGVSQSLLLAIFGAGGLLGFGLAFWLARIIQADVEALEVGMTGGLKAHEGNSARFF